MFVPHIGNEYFVTGTYPVFPRRSPHFQAAIMGEIHSESRHVANKRQFNWYNVLMVVAMSMGAFGYGYTNAVIGPTLGELPSTIQSINEKADELEAQPSFNEYFDLETRDNATALISSMSVRLCCKEMGSRSILTSVGSLLGRRVPLRVHHPMGF